MSLLPSDCFELLVTALAGKAAERESYHNFRSSMRFVSVNNSLRYSPAIHVNQVGYSPTSQKKAMLGYYLGNLGEMQIPANLGFKLVNAASGSQAYPTNGLATL